MPRPQEETQNRTRVVDFLNTPILPNAILAIEFSSLSKYAKYICTDIVAVFVDGCHLKPS